MTKIAKITKISKTGKSSKSIFINLNKPEIAAYFFVLPAVLSLFIFMVIPLISALVISLLQMDPFLSDIKFVGLSNFQKMISDERFWNALKNTIIFLLMETPVQIISGLLIAVYVSRNTIIRRYLRTVIFMPVVCSMVAIGIVWTFLLDPQIGMYPYYLKLLGLPQLEFLRDPNMAMPSIVFITVWKNVGYTMVILIAGIQAIPGFYYEAAEIDGAGKTRQFLNITIPMLVPALSFCIITNTIGSLQFFDQAFVMTGGGPLYRTESLVMYIYNRGFQVPPMDLGYASAIAVVLFGIIMTISLLMNYYLSKKETTDM